MYFVSSTVPFEELSTIESGMKDKWFLMQDCIKNKNSKAKGNDRLETLESLCSDYPIFYDKLPIYFYLMTDNYYYKSKFFKNNPCVGTVWGVEGIPHRYEDVWKYPEKYKFIAEEDRVCSKEEILKVFEIFKNHNFKENPICEVIIGKPTN